MLLHRTDNVDAVRNGQCQDDIGGYYCHRRKLHSQRTGDAKRHGGGKNDGNQCGNHTPERSQHDQCQKQHHPVHRRDQCHRIPFAGLNEAVIQDHRPVHGHRKSGILVFQLTGHFMRCDCGAAPFCIGITLQLNVDVDAIGTHVFSQQGAVYHRFVHGIFGPFAQFFVCQVLRPFD